MKKYLMTVVIALITNLNYAQTRVPSTDTNSPIWHKNNNVGIGVSDPRSQLTVGSSFGAHISGSPGGYGVFGSNIAVYSSGSDKNKFFTPYTHSGNYGYSGMLCRWGYLKFYTSSGNTSTGQVVTPISRLTITQSGDIGIGTDSPSKKLHVNSGRNGLLVHGSLGGDNYSDYQAEFTFTDLGISNSGIKINKKNGGSNFNLLNAFYNSKELFVIRSSGNVGIGNSSPEQSLSINTEQNKRALITIGAKGTADAGIYFDASNGDIKGADYGSLIQKDDLSIELTNYGNNSIKFRTNNTDRLTILGNGNVGIGKIPSNAKLDVAGNIKAQEIEVTLVAANNITYTTNGQTADHVFEADYNLRDLSEVEAFITKNNHLPEIPSAATMEEEGVNLAEMNKLLLQKVEELTLYAIEQKAEVERQKAEADKVRREESEAREQLEKEMGELKKLVVEMMKSNTP